MDICSRATDKLVTWGPVERTWLKRLFDKNKQEGKLQFKGVNVRLGHLSDYYGKEKGGQQIRVTANCC